MIADQHNQYDFDQANLHWLRLAVQVLIMSNPNAEELLKTWRFQASKLSAGSSTYIALDGSIDRLKPFLEEAFQHWDQTFQAAANRKR